ncbi:hypothetical protein ANN_08611 [Periplaneta americana]|uniref:Uncharacterized protein n=1 Tax=Periplaneta americana TaxID=6978 RepID=A0ABQ8T1W4_PERAM|nr:hypothetical protein ANN_08611 [Periplaneta americana]
MVGLSEGGNEPPGSLKAISLKEYKELEYKRWFFVKIVSGAVDARKWSVKWRKWNISDIFLFLSSVEGRKQRNGAETFAPRMGTMLSERARQENGFLVLRRVVLTLVTLPRSGRP